MTTLAIVEAGPLYVAADDRDHAPSVEPLSRNDLRLVAPRSWSPRRTSLSGDASTVAESAFPRGIGGLDVESPSNEDFIRMAELVEE